MQHVDGDNAYAKYHHSRLALGMLTMHGARVELRALVVWFTEATPVGAGVEAGVNVGRVRLPWEGAVVVVSLSWGVDEGRKGEEAGESRTEDEFITADVFAKGA